MLQTQPALPCQVEQPINPINPTAGEACSSESPPAALAEHWVSQEGEPLQLHQQGAVPRPGGLHRARCRCGEGPRETGNGGLARCTVMHGGLAPRPWRPVQTSGMGREAAVLPAGRSAARQPADCATGFTPCKATAGHGPLRLSPCWAHTVFCTRCPGIPWQVSQTARFAKPIPPPHRPPNHAGRTLARPEPHLGACSAPTSPPARWERRPSSPLQWGSGCLPGSHQWARPACWGQRVGLQVFTREEGAGCRRPF